jgi:aminopeptidase N
MTDRQGALMVLCGLDTPARRKAGGDFHARYAGNRAGDRQVVLAPGRLAPPACWTMCALAGHPDFTLPTPTGCGRSTWRWQSIPARSTMPSGAGYRMIADLILALDPLNRRRRRVSSPPLGRWRRIEPAAPR